MRVGSLLTREPADRYAPIGVHGRPVSDSYVTLKAALLQRFGPAHAACFARPDLDPRDETIGWIADVPGEARRWADLDPQEQARRALDLEAYRADLQAYAEALRTGSPDEDSAARSIAALLEHALVVPDESHVHFIGDQPVLSFWGFRRTDGGSVPALGLVPPAATSTAEDAVPPTVAAAEPLAERSWWRRLLWLLPLLLLLALLLLWLLWGHGCTGPEPVVEVPPTGERAERNDALDPSVRTDRDPGVVGVAPGGPSATIEAPAGGNSPAAPSPPASDAPGSAAEAPETPPPGEAPPPEDPSSEPPTPPEPPRPETPPAETPPAETPPAGPPLEIPPDAARSGDVGFLDGQWRSQRGLVDNVTGEPLEQLYRFDKDGTGEAIVRRSDGVECRGRAVGRFQDGQLVLEEEGSLACPDGRTYDRAVTRCERTASGLTVCRGVNPDGTGYRVGLEKMP